MIKRICTLLFVSLGPAWGQLQLQSLDHLASKAKESADINLDSAALQTAGSFLTSGKSDETAKKALSGLKALQVRTFEFAKAGEFNPNELEPIRKQLQSPGWSRILSARDGDESADIYIKSEQGKMVGLAILAAEPTELTVVYMEGSIDMNTLSNLNGQLGIPDGVIPGQQKNKNRDNKGKAEK